MGMGNIVTIAYKQLPSCSVRSGALILWLWAHSVVVWVLLQSVASGDHVFDPSVPLWFQQLTLRPLNPSHVVGLHSYYQISQSKSARLEWFTFAGCFSQAQW